MALTEADLKQIPETGIDPQNPGKYQVLLKDLQGNILKGHGREHSVHLFVQWKPEQVEPAKQWIADFAKNYVTSAQQQADEAIAYREQGVSGDMFANFFLTRFGYEALDIEPFRVPKDQPFTMGMKNSQIRDFLGDPAVEDWELGYREQIHALILIADDDINELLQTVNRLSAKLRQVALILHREDGFVIRNAKGQAIEHFGFVDGVSQPLYLKRDIERAKANNDDFSKWDPRDSLDNILVKDKNGTTEDSYGSYLVYRKLEQNVKLFRDDQRQLAQQLEIDEDLAGALVMGRFYDGTPVTESAVATDPDTLTNNFNFDQDVAATKCPFHAHIRKTNPRGDTGRVESSSGYEEALEVERAHRIARRAISYGEHDTTKEPETDAGLLFLCFQANIENQFNFMQARWANANRFVKVGVGPDPVIGQPEGVQKWAKKWGEPETEDYMFKLWAFMKGGEYFFAPSISFLTSL